MIQQALPALLGGLSANSSSGDGAAALLGTLSKHGGELPTSGLLDSIDIDDGQKIVQHVLGDRQDTVVNHLAADSGQAP